MEKANDCLKVETPLGTIVATKTTDPEHPGIWAGLKPPGGEAVEQEKIMLSGQNASNENYTKFLKDEGWKYSTEEDARVGFERMEKSMNGALLTLENFFAELRVGDDAEAPKRLYDALCGYVKKGCLSPYDLYQYARFRWCIKNPEAVVAYEIGPKRWAVNICGELIAEKGAKQRLNSEFGFEIDRIELLGTPYYDATDWNFIHFHCGPYDWLMWNGALHQIYQ